MKQFFKDNWFKLILTIPCLLLSVYMGILINNYLNPKPVPVIVQSRADKILHCLELGSDTRANTCLEYMGEKKMGAMFGRLFRFDQSE